MTRTGSLHVAVVGAGVAGLLCTRALVAGGAQVTLWDKGRSVGGRLATRRIGTADGTATFDHGAQFFTVRSDRFAAEIDPLVTDDLVHVWSRGFGPEPDGHPRYAVGGGMSRLTKRWAEGLDVRLDIRITDLGQATVGPDADRPDAWVVTAPAPQAAELLAASGVPVPDALATVGWDRTLAALVALDRPPSVPGVGGLQAPGAPFSFVADNLAKAVSTQPAVTLHADAATSLARWDDPDDEVLADLVAAATARGWLGGATVVAAQLKRWRYATPTPVLDTEVLASSTADGRPVVLAGDAFAGPRVEGAATSGWAAAGLLLA